MNRHPKDSEMPAKYRTKTPIKSAPHDVLDALMALCDAEVPTPATCLACYAYLVAQHRYRTVEETGMTE